MEIKPQELRIGNIIWSVEAKEPTEIFLMGIHRLLEEERDNKPRSYKPIELTPEWLERFGFKIHSDYDYRNYIIQHNRRFMISMWLGEGKPAGFEEYGTCYWGDDFKVIKTVHRLQNLYFALTGEELAIDKQQIK